MFTVEKGTGEAVHATFFCQLGSRIKAQIITNGTTLRLPVYNLAQKIHNVIIVPADHFQPHMFCQLFHRLPAATEFLIGMDVGIVEEAENT